MAHKKTSAIFRIRKFKADSALKSPDINERVAARIRLLRIDSGVTQKKMAERMHCNHATISKIESGTRKLCLDEAGIIANILGISFGELTR